MNRKTLISITLAAALACGLAIAQPPGGGHPDPEAHLQNLSVLLELSPQQQAQLRDMLELKRKEMEARREAGRESREQMREERKANREAFEQDIAAILNAEQQAKFKAIQAERRARHEQRRAMRQQRSGEG
ncbi:MAG TPA: periplasmic heavy metal sensor [Arenimonas sp.]|nr:periplasmic heavy metal sensor [Arenimonas sp.]